MVGVSFGNPHFFFGFILLVYLVAICLILFEIDNYICIKDSLRNNRTVIIKIMTNKDNFYIVYFSESEWLFWVIR